MEEELEKWAGVEHIWEVVRLALIQKIDSCRASLSDPNSTRSLEDVRRMQGKIEGLTTAMQLPKTEIRRLEEEVGKHGRRRRTD